MPCRTARLAPDVGVPRLPVHRCVRDRLAGEEDGVHKPHAPLLPASPGDAVAQRVRCHRWGWGCTQSRCRLRMRAVQDDTISVFWSLPLCRPALVPSGFRLQVHRMAQRSPCAPLLTESRMPSRVPRRTLSSHTAQHLQSLSVVILHHTTKRLAHFASIHRMPCGQLARSLGTFVPDFLKARGLRHQSSSWWRRLSRPPTTTPHPPRPEASGFRWGLSSLRPTPLRILQEASRVRHGRLQQHDGGGVLLAAPSALCGSPVCLQGRAG